MLTPGLVALNVSLVLLLDSSYRSTLDFDLVTQSSKSIVVLVDLQSNLVLNDSAWGSSKTKVSRPHIPHPNDLNVYFYPKGQFKLRVNLL